MCVFHLELADDFLSVTAYGMYADVEEVGDFGAFHAVVDKRQHLPLPFAQNVFGVG